MVPAQNYSHLALHEFLYNILMLFRKNGGVFLVRDEDIGAHVDAPYPVRCEPLQKQVKGRDLRLKLKHVMNSIFVPC